MDAKWSRSRKYLAYGCGIVLLAYAANAFFHHTAPGLGLKSRQGLYALGFFLPFGAILPALFLGWAARVGLATPRRLGVGLDWRDVRAIAVTAAAGCLLVAAPLTPLLRRPGGLAAAHRLFALLLVASTVEVLVFLGVLGNAIRLAMGGATKWRAAFMALVTSSLAFGFFHLTYPAPWNRIAVCLGLSLVWVLVSLVFLLSRSLTAAVVFNNFMAVAGFVRNGMELTGTAVNGWAWAIIAIAVFAFVFALSGAVRRVPEMSRIEHL